MAEKTTGTTAETALAGAIDDEFDGWTFEELVGELERVARQMEAPDLGIEEATDLYGRAGRLHAAASDRLARVQARVDALRGEGGGEPPGSR